MANMHPNDDISRQRVRGMNGALRRLRNNARDAIVAWNDDERFTMDELRKAQACIRPSAACWGLPYAALLSRHESMDASLLSISNLVLRFVSVPAIWLSVHTYHEGKA